MCYYHGVYLSGRILVKNMTRRLIVKIMGC